MLIISSTFYSVFNTIISLNLVIGCASSLLIGFFYFKPPEKRRVRLLVGVSSIIFGCVMVIISLFGILSFNSYLEVLNSEGVPASVFNLNIIFILFFLGVQPFDFLWGINAKLLGYFCVV
ncbi:MAG: hypothetical protein HWN81_17715 [Candidatus Lokiarchaeota archaeon]|nr:hypothetical protein [Candidatus Lokiarchaeota archaeon]